MSILLFLLQVPIVPAIERGIIGTLVYSAIGIIMCVVGFKIVDWLIPGHMAKQIAEDKNMAVAMVAAAMILGICIIIAAAIAS
ncbi:DUF350 domain-containing protein [Rhodocytophaga aerolata]|jgi:uncharacterized membrane protein YjfL (UPF0719 family)|uniref:DUF350 domain-containing protein n=1 Tax=Rhodocytophaga aerolata TaxID=455078 RepID=A0ABT8R0H0_9BACT|nr:DUF350 domain-containing protein [Rhodocytophaga aerolata]MDO1445581.1 DUF350 domain-containing protein [Rhodocytophaga aerolata]